MSSLLSRLRSGDSSQSIRQSTALTTVYLLEMNRKFESFMRDKVEELEGRVAAQQARLSTRTEIIEEPWEDTVIEAEKTPVDELDWNEVVPILDEALGPAPALAVPEVTISSDRAAPIINKPAPEPELAPGSEQSVAIPDYLTLLLGEPAKPESKAATEPSLVEIEEEQFEDKVKDDGANNMEDAPEIEAAREAEPVDQLDDEADVTGTTAAELPIEAEQPVDDGISALELFAETVEETIPWFDEELEDFEDVDDEPVDPDRSPEVNAAESDAWDASLPAAGYKGQWE